MDQLLPWKPIIINACMFLWDAGDVEHLLLHCPFARFVSAYFLQPLEFLGYSLRRFICWWKCGHLVFRLDEKLFHGVAVWWQVFGVFHGNLI